MVNTTCCDVLVVGAGMAGASLAAHAAAECDVVMLEAENQPGYHSTGRSAAQYIANYGPPDVRALTRASRGFFSSPPPGFSAYPLLVPRGMLVLATPDTVGELDAAIATGTALEPMALNDAYRLVPPLRPDVFAKAAYEARSMDIDVAGLHQGFLRLFKRRGGCIENNTRVEEITRVGRCWHVMAGGRTFEAEVVVNAAGAWADDVATLAGLGRIGLQPKRRTAFVIDYPDRDCARWPLVIDVTEQWYFKPEPGGKLLISPADATPVPAGDIQPDDLDIAIAVDRFETAVDFDVRRIEHQWAGLRTFAPDGSLVFGWAPEADGFFWLAGQGGYGIQTAPAAGRTAWSLIKGDGLPDDVRAHGMDVSSISPARFS